MDPRISKISIRSALSAIADIAMPRVCVVCGSTLIPQESDICFTCLSDFPKTRFSTMKHNAMADKFNEKIGAGTIEEHYCYATALFYYDEDSGYKNITQVLKYRRNFNAGRHFSRMLGEEMAESELFKDVDAVVPVPLHWTRKWKRGYNQAAIIGSEIAEILGCIMDDSIIKRVRRTVTQTKLNMDNKNANVSGAFVSKTGRNYNHILIVDDVFTTGSTLASCHSALRATYGASVRISIATLGYVK